MESKGGCYGCGVRRTNAPGTLSYDDRFGLLDLGDELEPARYIDSEDAQIALERVRQPIPSRIAVWQHLVQDVKVRVERIYEEDDPPRALTRRVGGPHDGITAICEVAKLVPVDKHESRAATNPQSS